VRLLDNPIFLTQKRLVHRAGVLAPLLIALLIGLSLLAAFFRQCDLHPGDRAEWGHMYYGWVLAIQTLVLVIGGFSRVSRTLVDERLAGLVDSNRLTPLSPADLVQGYWLGSGLRESYMAAVFMPVGLIVVLSAGLPITLWLGTQTLLITTALLFGLLAILTGMVLKRAKGGIGLLLLIMVIGPHNMAAEARSLLNFLLPMYATLHLFGLSQAQKMPQLFGIMVPVLVLTWALQLFMGVLCWRAAVRKMSDPTRPAFTRSVAVLVFGVLSLVQQGLIWPGDERSRFMIGSVYGAMLLLGVALVAALSLKPDQARIMTLRMGHRGQQWTFWHSGPAVALALSAVGSVTLAIYFMSLDKTDWMRWLLASINLVTVLVSCAVLIELSSLQFRRKTASFIALGMFVLYLLPFLLALVFQSQNLVHFSMVATGVTALTTDTVQPYVFIATITEVVVVGVLVAIWSNRWRKFLQPVSAT